MDLRIPERNKRPGVCYAATDEGIELPVIDVSRTEFRPEVDPAELPARFERHAAEMARFQRLPRPVRGLLLRLWGRRSILLKGVQDASGTFLGGMSTYLLKLGPANLGDGYASGIDRKIAAAYPALSVRFRLADTAGLMAASLARSLADLREQEIHLLNIAGGPASDSLNALILLRRDHPGLLEGRAFHIHVLDVQAAAPGFGRRALAALRAPGAPLHGVEVSLEHRSYDWSDVAPLRAQVRELGPGLVLGSSEGGLFHYGSDGEIVANLEALGEHTPPGFGLVGSLSLRELPFSPVPARALDLARFQTLAEGAGWRLHASLQRHTSLVFELLKRPRTA